MQTTNNCDFCKYVKYSFDGGSTYCGRRKGCKFVPADDVPKGMDVSSDDGDGSCSRRRLTKSEREQVFAKTDGHCAYCGCEIDIASMQVDHVIPILRGGVDEMSNMMPACRSCRHYKSSRSVDGFRDALERMPGVLMRDSVTYKNAVRYELVTPTPNRVRFFFERLGDVDTSEAELKIHCIRCNKPVEAEHHFICGCGTDRAVFDTETWLEDIKNNSDRLPGDMDVLERHNIC